MKFASIRSLYARVPTLVAIGYHKYKGSKWLQTEYYAHLINNPFAVMQVNFFVQMIRLNPCEEYKAVIAAFERAEPVSLILMLDHEAKLHLLHTVSFSVAEYQVHIPISAANFQLVILCLWGPSTGGCRTTAKCA